MASIVGNPLQLPCALGIVRGEEALPTCPCNSHPKVVVVDPHGGLQLVVEPERRLDGARPPPCLARDTLQAQVRCGAEGSRDSCRHHLPTAAALRRASHRCFNKRGQGGAGGLGGG